MLKVVNAVCSTLSELRNDIEDTEEYETGFIESAINKMAGLLHVGFGVAGASIIQNNLRNSGDLNPMVAGKKVFCSKMKALCYQNNLSIN